MKANEVRQRFLDFYLEKEHQLVKSAPLVPHDDPTLLFTSAGMVQFKKYYSGSIALPYARAVSVQKCLRVTDIDEVGRTPRHDTFFEMLGHFSFGDYFKSEACRWNWDLFTRVYGIDPEKLTASVFEEDDEAYKIWRDEVGLPDDRIVRLGADDNFWGPAGGTGACGPCSELYYDLGPDVDPDRPEVKPGDDCNRFVEVGNFVFPQFDRQADGTDQPLKNRGIDTGIGLERLVMVLQGKTSIFHTDLFWPLVERAGEICGRSYDGHEVPLHIIADHVRALTFALGEGILPSNEGRGYVIRRLIRRAAVQGYTLGLEEPFLFNLVDLVVEMMHAAYPEVEDGRERAVMALRKEEERFQATLDQGLGKLQTILDLTQKAGGETVDGEQAFVLYDTYGLPLDLMRDMALGQGLSVDEAGYERCMAEQKDRSRAATSFSADLDNLEWHRVSEGGDSNFRGYETLTTESRVRRFARIEAETDQLVVVLDQTPFYGESGGQMGDTGDLTGGGIRLRVVNTLREGPETHHIAEVDPAAGGLGAAVTALEASDQVWTAVVDEPRRRQIQRHHTATHILHKALRTVLGKHVAQAGSLVAPERLRFDFTHFSALEPEQQNEIERIANRIVQEDLPIEVEFSSYDDAIAAGVTALFGEKYDADEVRRVRIPGFSEELCGGTHVSLTGQIGPILIVDETAVASGTRRLEAVCGLTALEEAQQARAVLTQVRRLLGATAAELPEKVGGLLKENSGLRKDLAKARRGEGVTQLDALLDQAVEAAGGRYLVGEVAAGSADELRELGDRVRKKLGSGAAVLCGATGKKTSFLAVVTDDLISAGTLRADELVRSVAAVTGGGGGGRPHMALGGAADVSKVPEALEEAKRLLAERLG